MDKRGLSQRSPTLADLYRLARFPKTQVRLWKDMASTWLSTGFIRSVEVDSEASSVMVCMATESVFEAKLLLFLAGAFRLRGWRVVAVFDSITSRRSWLNCKASGADEVHILQRAELNPTQRQQIEIFVETHRRRTWDIPSLKALTFEGCWIGPQIISTLSRASYETFINLEDEPHKSRVSQLLALAASAVYQARNLLERVQPMTILCMEAHAMSTGPLIDVAILQALDVIQVVQPWRDDALIFKRLTKETRRKHPSSIEPATLDLLCQSDWGAVQEAELGTVLADRYAGRWSLQARNTPPSLDQQSPIDLQLGLNPDLPTAVVFSHVLWDANLFYGEDLFQDYGEWLVETARAAALNPSVNWIVKIHPANLWKQRHENVRKEYEELRLLRKHVGDLPPHISLLMPRSPISALHLYKTADYGITVRGTPGLEMAAIGKPVLTAGTGRYSHLGFTHDSATRREYLEKLLSIHELPSMSQEERRRAKIHAHAIFLLRPWFMKSIRAAFNFRETGSHPLDHNVMLTVKSAEQAANRGDLDSWFEWANSSSLDFLNSAAIVAGN